MSSKVKHIHHTSRRFPFLGNDLGETENICSPKGSRESLHSSSSHESKTRSCPRLPKTEQINSGWPHSIILHSHKKELNLQHVGESQYHIILAKCKVHDSTCMKPWVTHKQSIAEKLKTVVTYEELVAETDLEGT